MFLPSSVRHAIYLNRCSFRTSDGMQRKKPPHPPKTHSFRLAACFPFPMLLSASSAAGFLRRYSESLPGCVLRSRYQDFLSLLFWFSRTAYLRVSEVHSLHLPHLSFLQALPPAPCTNFHIVYFLTFLYIHFFLFYFFEVRVSSFIIQDHNVISLAFRKQNASSRCSIYDATVTTEMLRQLAQIEVKNTTQKKIGRNDPCPCGSEKK